MANSVVRIRGKSFKDIDKKMQKEAKIKYASFMLGSTQINELDKSKISLKDIRKSNDENNNNNRSYRSNGQVSQNISPYSN